MPYMGANVGLEVLRKLLQEIVLLHTAPGQWQVTQTVRRPIQASEPLSSHCQGLLYVLQLTVEHNIHKPTHTNTE